MRPRQIRPRPVQRLEELTDASLVSERLCHEVYGHKDQNQTLCEEFVMTVKCRNEHVGARRATLLPAVYDERQTHGQCMGNAIDRGADRRWSSGVEEIDGLHFLYNSIRSNDGRTADTLTRKARVSIFAVLRLEAHMMRNTRYTCARRISILRHSTSVLCRPLTLIALISIS